MAAEVAVMANPEYEQLLENLRLLKLGSLVPVLESHLKRAAKGSVSYQDFLAGLVLPPSACPGAPHPGV
jgi:hypothetical protein